MNLLLILSAILSALTGAAGSSRAVAAPSVASCAVAARAAETVAARPTQRVFVAARAPLARVIDRAAFVLAAPVVPYLDRPLE